MENQTVYFLEIFGSTSVHFSVRDLLYAIEFEITEQPIGTSFTTYSKVMTQKEIDELPEFEGY